MRPPICAVCNVRFSARDGGTVRFANYEPLGKDDQGRSRVGHPKGLEWFCAEHIAAAKALAELTSRDAIAQMRK